ncbi:MAG: hypothetical protein M3308_05830 [Actinomycetota bacterium]|nr:hypothetical protein [Actinomycetota bacterium]
MWTGQAFVIVRTHDVATKDAYPVIDRAMAILHQSGRGRQTGAGECPGKHPPRPLRATDGLHAPASLPSRHRGDAMTSLLLTATTAVDGLEGSGLLIAALVVLGWLLVLIALFPNAPHKPCGGTGKHQSGQYWRDCRGCKGSGRRLRLGRQVWNWTLSREHSGR